MRLSLLALFFFLYTVSAVPHQASSTPATKKAFPAAANAHVTLAVNNTAISTQRACPAQHLGKRYIPNPDEAAIQAAVDWAIHYSNCPIHHPPPGVKFIKCQTWYRNNYADLKIIYPSNMDTVAKEVQHLLAVKQLYAWGQDCHYQVFFIVMTHFHAYTHHQMEALDHRFTSDLDFVLDIQDEAILDHYLNHGIIKRNLHWKMDFVYYRTEDHEWAAEIVEWGEALFTGRILPIPKSHGPWGPFLIYTGT